MTWTSADFSAIRPQLKNGTISAVESRLLQFRKKVASAICQRLQVAKRPVGEYSNKPRLRGFGIQAHINLQHRITAQIRSHSTTARTLSSYIRAYLLDFGVASHIMSSAYHKSRLTRAKRSTVATSLHLLSPRIESLRNINFRAIGLDSIF